MGWFSDKPKAIATLRCGKCGAVYEIGVDSAIFSMEDVMGEFAAGGSSVLSFGSGAGSTPDRVDKGDAKAVARLRAASEANWRKAQSQSSREWKCAGCNQSQRYQP
jgi:hypothetical protein